MGNQVSQILSLFLHAGIAGLALFYQPAMQPLEKGDGFLMELSEGPTPKGETLIPPIEKPKKIKVKKVAQPVTKPAPTQIVVKQKESAKVVTQNQESPIKAAPEATAVVGSTQASVPEKKFGVEEGIRDARQLQQIKGNRSPLYPRIDRINKRQGKVVVLGFVNDLGKVKKLKLESSTGTRKMNYNALKAFSKYRFEKGQEGWVRMPFEFVLKGPTQEIQSSRQRTGRTIR